MYPNFEKIKMNGPHMRISRNPPFSFCVLFSTHKERRVGIFFTSTVV